MSKDQWLNIDGLDIRYRVCRTSLQARGRVLVLPGFTEFIEKHETTCQRFNDLGFDALVLDWPGQGRSTRLTSYSPHLIHSLGFDLHLNCLDMIAHQEGFIAGGDLPVFLFGHSMGGHLAMRFAKERMPQTKGVILTAPMMLPPASPGWLMLGLAQLFCWAGFGRYPVLFQDHTPRNDIFFSDNALTRHPDGYAVQPGWWARDQRLCGYGASFGWVRDAYRSCLATTANHRWMEAFSLPLSVHIAGDERIVHDATTRTMLDHVRTADIHDYEDARHELLLELPEVVESLWQKVAEFIHPQALSQ